MDYKTININGTEYKTLLTKKYLNRKKWNPDKINEIKTVIPGTVVQLNVKKGDKVQEGDILLLFEAMKMQNIIAAPLSGIVTSIEVQEGDKLPKGTLIMTIG